MTCILILTAILVMCLACSETETPLNPHRSIEHQPPDSDVIVEPVGERVLLEAPPDIPHGLAASFAHIRGELKEEIYQDLLRQVDRYCQGALRRNTLLIYLKKRLPPQVFPGLNLHAHRLTRIPAATRADKDRIRVAAQLVNPNMRGLSFTQGNVYYYFNANTIFISTRLDGYDMMGHFTDDDDRASNIYNRIEKLTKRLPPGKPVVIPEIPEDLELDIIILDENGFPKNPKYRGWVDDFDDTPRATDEQIAEYNRIHSPNAYDCVEE